MKTLGPDLLEQLVNAFAEPAMVASTVLPDWPVTLCNSACESLVAGEAPLGRPLADVIERLHGRNVALEVSETVRSGEPASIPVEVNKREQLLVMQPLSSGKDSSRRFCALFWRGSPAANAAPADGEVHHALRRARRRVRDLSRDDAATGLLNEAAFRDVLGHDWAVAAREKGTLALIAFRLDHFEAYLEVFGRHATDSCLRRVAQAVRRCMRRASDVAARITAGEAEYIVVLSHASEGPGVHDFAERIASAVRDLGLHHPRSKSGRFVTVSPSIAVVSVERGDGDRATAFLESVLSN